MARVLRLPRIGGGPGDGDFILVYVAPIGPRPFGLETPFQLIGTENETVFAVSLEHSQTSKLRQKNSSVNQEEWDEILSAVLLGAVPEEERSSLLNGVEAVGRVDSDASSMTIIIQKRIEGITQRLGNISLPANEDEQVDLYEWCGLSVKSKDESSEELKTLKKTLQEQDSQIKKLNGALSELISLKTENENQMLEKFSLLLNEKKLKIRDQQRLLASSDVDPAKLEVVEESRTAVRLHSAGVSRTGKRKADARAQVESDDETEAEFEQMEVDNQSVDDSGQEERRTPEDSTADETESEDEVMPAPSSSRPAGHIKQKEKEDVQIAAPVPIPPKRELPFAMKPKAKSVPAVEGSETESDDDEL